MAEKEYIEREAARKLICGFCADYDGTTDLCEYRDIQVDAIPAADVRPVVRGKWKHGVCQTCLFDWPGVAPFASVPRFCPNCGADMREES